MIKLILLSACAASLASCDSSRQSSGAGTDPEPAASSSAAAPSAAPLAESAAPKPYPLEVCLVSGEPLDSMDGEVVYVHEGQELRFCCKPCIPKFKMDPEKYLSQLE